MPRFRKIPVTIEAFEMTEDLCFAPADWPEWLGEAWCKDVHETGSLYSRNDGDPATSHELLINTLEGVMAVDWGDYIIQGVKGELYPCKPDIFHMTYEPVTEE
jgi:hypothetical protein